MKKIVAIIQARLGSTRLPAKVIKPILGLPMLARHIERIRQANTLDAIVIATPNTPKDKVLLQLSHKLKLPSFAGSETDVLDRYYQTAQKYHASVIVRLTSDCPLIDPSIIDQLVNTFNRGKFDYVSNVHQRSFPRGMDVEVFSFKALSIAWKKARSAYNREHVTPYIYSHPRQFKIKSVIAPPQLKHPHLRLTVDEPADLTLIRKIYQALYPQNPRFNLQDVINFLITHPKVAMINQPVKQKYAPYQSFAPDS